MKCDDCHCEIFEDQDMKCGVRDGVIWRKHGDVLDCELPAEDYIDEAAVIAETEGQ